MVGKQAKKRVVKGNKTHPVYTSNKATITQAISYYLKKYKEVPTITYLHEATGISRKTISKHFQELSLPNYLQRYRTMTDDVMQALTNTAKAGNVHAIKLWFQLAWDWKEPSIKNSKPDEERYTQINIKIVKKDGTELTPQEKKQPLYIEGVTSEIAPDEYTFQPN